MSKTWKPLVERVRQVVELGGMDDIPDGEFRAFVVALLHYADCESGSCFPSRQQLAERSCVSDRTVKRMWLRLESKGIATRDDKKNSGGRNRRNVYTIKTRSPAPGLQDETRSPAPHHPDNGGRKTRSPAPPHLSSNQSSQDYGENCIQNGEDLEAERNQRFWSKRLEQNRTKLQHCEDPERRQQLEASIARAEAHLRGAA